jgi:DNA-binding CsgD family transcriptional regulator
MTTAAPVRETENPYLNGNFAPVREEITATDLDFTGTIPEFLDGRYLRIGPNPIGDPDPARYLLKDASRPELAGAVRDSARGKTVLAPSVADRLVRFVRQPASAALSTREIEVLGLVAVGKTNADIGRELHISEATVKTHLLRTFNKLGVSDRTAAVTTAMSMGLLG